MSYCENLPMGLFILVKIIPIFPTHAIVHVQLEFALRDRLLDPLAVAGVAGPPPAPPPVVHQAARLLAIPVVGAAASRKVQVLSPYIVLLS